MSSNVVYRYFQFEPHSSRGLFIHGYSDTEAVDYCLVVARLGGAETGGPITITQGETYRHVDGTVARKVYIANPTPSWFHVDVIETKDPF